MEWVARVFNNPPITLIETDDHRLFAINKPFPDIWTIATFIRNRKGVFRVATPDPMRDTKVKRKYTEYHFLVMEE